ncbi:MAG: hypothetical protein OSB69_21635 [Alphaproteobacteria bacterium]|jgi:hypothetical protein|nr:hypothetical protein [Alphaproteobacteria bacterium]
MGAPFDTGTWTGVKGAYYVALNSQMEVVWLLVSVACCLVALWVGSKHETDAYKKLND